MTSRTKKTPAKKPAAASKTTRGKAGASKKRARPKSGFRVYDKVVHPQHGAAKIVKRRKATVAGVKQEYFVLEILTQQLTVMVPVAKVSDIGLRPVISKNAARKVFQVLRSDPVDADATWARWFKLLQDKMASGDIYLVAEVVRDLTYAQQSKPLGPALKRMIAKARLILTSELRLALTIDEETAERRLDKSLTHLIVEESEDEPA